MYNIFNELYPNGLKSSQEINELFDNKIFIDCTKQSDVEIIDEIKQLRDEIDSLTGILLYGDKKNG